MHQMMYSEFHPAAELRDYIRCYWLLNSHGQPVTLQNKLIPFGCIDLIFQQTPTLFYHSVCDEQRIQLPQFIISSQSVKAFDIEIAGAVRIFGIRLQPHAARCIFKMPVTRLNNTIWPMRNKLGEEYHRLGEAITNMEDTVDMVKTMNDFFATKLKQLDPVDYVIKNISSQLLNIDADIALQDIFKEYKETDQALRLRFQNQVGLSPKFFQKLVRLHYALAIYWNTEYSSKSLTALALEAGYYDQAHLIRDFHAIFKAAPKDFFNASFPITRHYVNPCNLSCLLHEQLSCIAAEVRESNFSSML